MRRLLLLIPLAALVAAAVAATGAAAHRAPARAAKAATVDLRKTRLGRVLVTSSGRTLYLFEKDRGGKSSCYSSCAKFWPPYLTSGKPHAGTGVRAALLGTTRRTDGKLQVTYNKHPLYRFSMDTAAGQTKGEGLKAFGAEWYVLGANGKKIEKAGSSGY
jgi:predicted lipoprotein with Yx(FWY)xxD motif